MGGCGSASSTAANTRDEFHQVVNMTSEELRTWLLTGASGEDALPADPLKP
jgi:hypothetical protein